MTAMCAAVLTHRVRRVLTGLRHCCSSDCTAFPDTSARFHGYGGGLLGEGGGGAISGERRTVRPAAPPRSSFRGEGLDRVADDVRRVEADGVVAVTVDG